MEWNRRNIIMIAVLAVLLPVAVYMNIKNLRSGRPSRSRVIPAPQAAFTPPPAVEGEAPVGEPGREARLFQPVPVNTAQFKKLVASGQWGRDPFLTPGEIRGMLGGEVGEPELRRPAAVGQLLVSSVLISGKQAVAIINNDIYTVGDFVADTGEVVIGINRDGVLLEGPQGQRLIQLEQSKIPLKSVEK